MIWFAIVLTMSELSLYSQKVRATAQKLLDGINLVEILGKYGEVKIGGSFKYDLMWGARY